ncbi:hypothetical protein [Schlesneria paludicola]|uniref:hypothetical protein n=1 Tax=Schlesneria paludicola TaxID=360056 RepID=UPI0012F9B6CB|nr:hypothetical protein [Schlesneria paludicola]
MSRQNTTIVGLLCLVCFASGCSRGPVKKPISNKVPLSKVSGTVIVDGVPTPNVLVQYDPQSSIAESREQILRGFVVMTTRDGKFALHTYERGDGVPPGEYALSFKMLQQLPSGEKDLLGGKYSSKKKPFKVIKVEPDQPLELGDIELAKSTEKAK